MSKLAKHAYDMAYIVAHGAVLTAADALVLDRTGATVYGRARVSSATVYKYVPDLPSGLPGQNFPFVEVELGDMLEWSADDFVGLQGPLGFHVWSRSTTDSECYDIAAEIAALFDRASLTRTGINVVDCQHSTTSMAPEPDGRLRHLVANYTLTITEE